MIWHIWNREYEDRCVKCEVEQVGELPPVVLKRWGFSSVERLPSIFKNKNNYRAIVLSIHIHSIVYRDKLL